MLYSRRDGLRLMGSAALTGIFLEACARQEDTKDAAAELTFASPAPVWWNAVPLIAGTHNLYEKHGVRLRAFDVPTGVKSKEAIVAGNALTGVSSPNAFSITTDADLAKLKILASITQSSATVTIISRQPIENLTNTRIGYVRGAISEFYLIAYLIKTNQLQRYTKKQISLVSLPPPGLVSAFANREVDTVSAWEPFASQIIDLAKKRGEQITTVRDSSLYTQHIFALASSDALKQDRRSVERLLKALGAAGEYIRANRPAVAAELEKYFQFPDGFLAKGQIWPNVAFDYSTDVNLIHEALTRDLELARHAGVAQASEVALSTVLSELS